MSYPLACLGLARAVAHILQKRLHESSTFAKRVANRAGHFGSRLNCALESNGLSQFACQLKSEHNLIPFHCDRGRIFGDWPGPGEGAAGFFVFSLFLVAVHSQPLPQNGLPTVPVILVADSIVPL